MKSLLPLIGITGWIVAVGAAAYYAQSRDLLSRVVSRQLRASGQGDSLDALAAEQAAKERLRSHVYNRDDEERLAAEERLGHQNLAWPPQAQARPLIEKLPPRIARDDCGCLWFEGGLWSPCGLHDTGILRAHIDTHADAWAAQLAEEDQ